MDTNAILPAAMRDPRRQLVLSGNSRPFALIRGLLVSRETFDLHSLVYGGCGAVYNLLNISEMNDERSKEFENPEDRAGKRELTLLEAFDLILASIPPDDRNRPELFVLRSEIAAQEETIGEARQV